MPGSRTPYRYDFDTLASKQSFYTTPFSFRLPASPRIHFDKAFLDLVLMWQSLTVCIRVSFDFRKSQRKAKRGITEAYDGCSRGLKPRGNPKNLGPRQNCRSSEIRSFPIFGSDLWLKGTPPFWRTLSGDVLCQTASERVGSADRGR